jgi:uroporphyrinogen-III synthase
MERRVVDAGGRAVVIPMIEILPPESWSDCDGMLERLDTFDAAAFASVNAVESFCSRALANGKSLQGRFPSGVLVVGRATAESAKAFGLPVVALRGASTGRGLGAAAGEGFAGVTVLLPCGNLARTELPDTLRRAGAHVTTVVVYRTAPPPRAVLANAAERVRRGEFDVVTFASPSAVRNFLSAFAPDEIPSLRRWCAVAVIGPTTASALHSFGIEPDIVAMDASGSSFVESIIGYF